MHDVIEKPKTDLRSKFVPVIFANGHDDDLPGFVAAVQNEAVLFDGDVHKPSESIFIVGRNLRFTKKLCVVSASDDIPSHILNEVSKWLVVIVPESGRHITVKSCSLNIPQ